MQVVTVPWAAVPPLGEIVGPDGQPLTVLPFAHPLVTHRALLDAAGAVRIVGVDPLAPVRMLVPDLADALVTLAQAGFRFTIMSTNER
jgi:hypothetical protein